MFRKIKIEQLYCLFFFFTIIDLIVFVGYIIHIRTYKFDKR